MSCLIDRLDRNDFARVIHGIVLLAAVVVLGIVAADYQLNALTSGHACVRVIGFGYDSSGYIARFFGEEYKAHQTFSIGTITNTKTEFRLKIGEIGLAIPLRWGVDLSFVFRNLEGGGSELRRQADKWAKATGRWLEDYGWPALADAITGAEKICDQVKQDLRHYLTLRISEER